MSAHAMRKGWEESFPKKDDNTIQRDIRHVAKYMHNVGPPYGATHYDWVAIRCVLLREARKRGLDFSAIAPARK